MKRLATYAVCVLMVGQAGAACLTTQCRDATRWHQGYTAVILRPDIRNAEREAARDAIEAAGGHVAIVIANLMTAWIPSASAQALIGQHGIQVITRAPLELQSLGVDATTHWGRNATACWRHHHAGSRDERAIAI